MREAGGKGKGKGKGPDGQKEAPLSELDMLIGDVLYFNHRVGHGSLLSRLPPVAACSVYSRRSNRIF